MIATQPSESQSNALTRSAIPHKIYMIVKLRGITPVAINTNRLITVPDVMHMLITYIYI